MLRGLPLVALTGVGLILLAVAGAGAARAEPIVLEFKARDGKPAGKGTITDTGTGLLIQVRIEGLTPGAHALRFHETGVCEGDFASAGGVYNPLGAKHGLLNEDGPAAGDLPNIFAGADGVAEAELLSPFIHLGSDDDVSLTDEDGTAIVVFEKPDDHVTDPDGGAGAAVACAVVAPKK